MTSPVIFINTSLPESRKLRNTAPLSLTRLADSPTRTANTISGNMCSVEITSLKSSTVNAPTI